MSTASRVLLWLSVPVGIIPGDHAAILT
jgi:hypothetical protein